MADGNVGSLYMTLGLKDEVSVGLNKVAKNLSKSKQYTDDLKKEVEGLRKELKNAGSTDMAEPIKKALSFIKEYDKEVYKSIGEINKLAYALRGVFQSNDGEIKIKLSNIPNAINELAKLSSQLNKIEDKDEKAALKAKVSNAMEYLKILQAIERKQRELNDLSKSSRNIDKAEIANAKSLLNNVQQSLVKQLFNQKSGSLVSTNFMSEIKKLLSMSMTEINDHMRNLKKDNPLSVFANSADMLTSKIASANRMILEMQSLMRGSSISNLMNTDSLDKMRGVVGTMMSYINKEGAGQKTERSKIDKLVSDYAKLSSEMNLAMSTFRKMSREYDNANARLVSWYAKYRELQSIKDKMVKFGLDTRGVDSELNRIRAMVGEINAIRSGLRSGKEDYIGMLGSRGTGLDNKTYANVAKAANEEIAARERISRQAERFVEREVQLEQKRNEQRLKDIDKESKARQKQQLDIEQADAAEYNRKKRQAEQRLSDINREGVALQKNAEIQQRLQNQQERSRKKQDNESLKEEYRLRDAKLKQLDREGKAIQKNAEMQQRLQNQQERNQNKAEAQRQRELEISRRRIQSLENAYDRLKAAMFTSKSFGLDTRAAEIKLNYLITDIGFLNDKIRGLSGINFKDFLGTNMYVGTGRTVNEANNLASQYEQANRQAARNEEIEQRRKQKISESGRQIQSSLVKGFKDANNAAGRLNSTVQDLKSLFLQGGLVFGAQQFAMNIIRTGGEMEKQHIAMQSILGDMQNANTMFNQIKELALKSPFTFSELNRDVKQLAAYGVEYENLYDTTKRLADMASGLGVSFERIALAFGQVQARGWLDGKELRQIAYAGIPLLDRLSKYYSQREGKKVSTSDVKKRISNREVSFEDVKNIFWEMTDAGGQFYNMQLTLSETLLGRYNKLKDAWEIMLADFARGDSVIGGTFKWILDLVTSIVQQMHTLGPVMAAAFTGFVLKKGIVSMGGTKGSSFLSSKANIASDLQNKVLQGQQLSAVEQRILATKNRITNEDLKALSASRALTLQDLNRLRIAGQITAEQYKQYRNIVKQQIGTMTLSMEMKRLLVTMRGLSFSGGWANFSSSGLAAIRIVGVGVKNLTSSLWSALGGLPGILISAATMGITYLINKNETLKQAMSQTAEELKDRYRQIGEFIRDNNVDKAIAKGDQKEIDNLIESYQQKYKDIAPYDFDALVMSSEEKTSHAERLKYLEEQLKLLQSANELVQEKAGDKGTYEAMKFNMTEAKNAAEQMLKARDGKLSYGAGENANQLYLDAEENFGDTIDRLKTFIKDNFNNINESPEAQAAYKQFRESMIAQIAPTEEAGNVIRAALDSSLGLSNGWLETMLLSKGYGLIENVAGELALKIRSGKELNKAEKQKVYNLMESAANDLSLSYPMFRERLQSLLNESDFIAKIKLVYTPMNDIESQVFNNLSGRNSATDFNLLKPFMNGSSGFYETTNKAKQQLESKYQEYKSRQEKYKKGKVSKALVDEAKKEYDTLWNAVSAGLGYDYIPEDKKSNKTPKGNKEDAALKTLNERINAFKSFRQMYQKAKEIMSKEKAKEWSFGLFPEMKGLNPDDYIGSIEKLKKGFNFDLSPERKKALTSLNREIGDWKLSEILKPEFERVAANFKEALDKSMKQWDIYKSLFDKTGNEQFASLSFQSGGVFDEQARNLINAFESDYKIKFPGIYQNDGDAKKAFDGLPGAYERWKAIADLVKNNYYEYLQKAADIMEKTASFSEKEAAIRGRYGVLISTAESQGDNSTAARYRVQMNKEIGTLKIEEFKQSSDYLKFFSSVMTMTAEQAQDTAEKIKSTLLKSLGDGSLSAREYAKQIEQINGELKKVSNGKKTFWNSGAQGVREQKIQDAYDQQTNAAIDYDTALRKYNEAMIKGNELDMEIAKKQEEAALIQLKAAGKNIKKEEESKKIKESTVKTVEKINDNINSFVALFNDIKETADLLGVDTETDAWQDVSATTESIQGVSNSVSTAVQSFQSGNIMGVVQGVVGVFTSPIKAFAKAHDAKLERRITQGERNIRAINNMSNNISSVLEKILGGIYRYNSDKSTTEMLKEMMKNNEKGSDAYNAAQKALSSGNYFDTQYAALVAQRAEIQRQRDWEDDKKKTDRDKLADYDQQLAELDLQIKSFAQDFLQTMYSIDMKSWAKELTDAVVSAWEKGEDAVDAYRDKVKELVKDLTKNILSQKIMEQALEKPLDYLMSVLKQKGKLEESDVEGLVDQLYNAGENSIDNITAILEALKRRGYDFSESGSSSTRNTIKGITEETADLLASYLNAIRLDVSVNRENIRLIMQYTSTLPRMSVVAESQLQSLNTLVSLAESRNSKLDDMYSWMNKVTNGILKLNVK